MINLTRILLGRALRRRNISQLTYPGLRELLDKIGATNVDISEVRTLVEKINEGLKGEGLCIEIRKSPPWDTKADYRLALRKVRRG